MLVVNASSPWKSLKEVVDHSKKSPGEVTFSISGVMGITHLLAEIFAKEAGVSWRHIPFQGSDPAITALLGGPRDVGRVGHCAGQPGRAGRRAAAARPGRVRGLPAQPEPVVQRLHQAHQLGAANGCLPRQPASSPPMAAFIRP